MVIIEVEWEGNLDGLRENLYVNNELERCIRRKKSKG